MEESERIRGHWWLPNNRTCRHIGWLSYDKDSGARLELSIEVGSLPFSQSDAVYGLIHGETDDGREISLAQCFLLGPLRLTKFIFAHFIFDGFLLPSVDDANIKTITAAIPFLSTWFGSTGLDVAHSTDYRDFVITYKSPPTLTIQVNPSMQIEFSVGTSHIPMRGLPGAKLEFRETVRLSLHTVSSESFRDLLSSLQAVSDLFTLMCMNLCSAEEIHLEGDFTPVINDGKVRYPHARLHFSPVYSPEKKTVPHPMDLFLRRADLGDNLQSVLVRWMDISNDLKPVRALYLSALYGEHTYIENKFLSLCQAAEIFHRRFRRGEYMNPDKYENEVLPKLVSLIPSELPGELTEAMAQRFEYLNEYSLAKRLKELVSENQDTIFELVPDIKEVVRSIVEARNHFTHFSPKGPHHEINGEKIQRYVHILRMIVELSVLKEIGVASEALGSAAQKNEIYRRMFRLNR